MIKRYPTKNGKQVSIRIAKIEDADAIIELINTVCAEKVYTPVERYIHDAEWEKNFIREHVEGKKDALLVVAEIDNRI